MAEPDMGDAKIPASSKHWLGHKIRALKDYTPYPRAHDNRVSIHNKEVHLSRVALGKAALKSFVLLQLLFFALFCYIFGALYQQNTRVHNLNVAFVDYDGGAVGQAIRAAYGGLKKESFLTLQEKSAIDYPQPESLKDAVCKVQYWAALYITEGSSDAIAAALNEGNGDYNKAEIMTYIWNEARYSAIIDASVAQNLAILSNAARVVYAGSAKSNFTDAQHAYSIFANPWTLSNDNIQATTQGSRLVYNTLVIILILIQEFFYLGSLNQLYEVFKIYQRLEPRRIIFYRNLFSALYCLVGSLFVTSVIWIFRAGWHVGGRQFMLTWMLLWLFAHLNFLTLDVFTAWLPPPFVPMALISWVILNVTSVLLPFELQSDFYKWAYAMPAHEVYNALIDIWSHGCNPVLRYSLTVLFAFELSSLSLAALGIYKRCHFATIRAEAEDANFHERIAKAIAIEKKRRIEDEEEDEEEAEKEGLARKGKKEVRTGVGEIEEAPTHETSEFRAADDERDKLEAQELSEAMRGEFVKLRQLRSNADEKGGFGPAFGFNFGPRIADHDHDAVGADVERQARRPSQGMKLVSRKRTAGA